ncbi:DUF4294 domain-containing protein [Membranicola marinus]|uniref:DUF4294 domain-containing protein n=1 Tax=Membranihabitans marinus TaxID=1227546 RepID=A0A953L9P4_9BACT|nr:DUF4294 domain-containing protein [Membranihabitans marinus]MBY5957838.1 DUF4294 domain-containing protein [Membranihabitans marinus]
MKTINFDGTLYVMMKTLSAEMITRLLGFLLFWMPAMVLPAQNPMSADSLTQHHKQDSIQMEDLVIDGEIVQVIIDGDDTLLMSTFDEISVTSKRFFASNAEYRRYLIYRKYAQDVYPFAVEAIQTYETIERVTADLSIWKKRKYARRVQEQLFKKYEDIFKNLTKTQGRILIHMIEKELDIPMYVLIRNARGWLTANYWSTLSGFFDYDLKEGYQVGKDPIMDMVLDDFDVKFNE